FSMGFNREVPRIVPPRWSIPETEYRVSGSTSPVTNPAQPFFTPSIGIFSIIARRTAARITAFNPGQSPPPVNIPIFSAGIMKPYSSRPQKAEVVSSDNQIYNPLRCTVKQPANTLWQGVLREGEKMDVRFKPCFN